MIQDKIKKGDLLKANTRMRGHYFSQSQGGVNILIDKGTLLMALADVLLIDDTAQVEVILDNKIVSVDISEENQLGVVG